MQAAVSGQYFLEEGLAEFDSTKRDGREAKERLGKRREGIHRVLAPKR